MKSDSFQRQSTPTPTLVSNFAINFSGHIVLFAAAILTTPYILTTLGAHRYGTLVVLLAYAEVFGLLELGLNATLVKYLAESLAQDRHTDLNNYFGTSLSLFLGGGVLISLLVYLSAPFILASLTRSEVYDAPGLVVPFLLATMNLVLRFITQPFAATPIARQRFDVVTSINIGTELLRIAGTVLVLGLGYSLVAVLLVMLLSSATAACANIIATTRLIPSLRLRPTFSHTHFRAIVHFSKYILLANISGRVLHSLDKLLLAQFVPVRSLAFYAVAYSLGQRLWVIIGPVTTALFPAATAIAAAEQRDRLSRLYVRSSKIVAAFATFPAVVLCILSHELLSHWIDGEFGLHASTPLKLLSTAFLLNCLAHIPQVFAQATGHPRLTARYAVLNALSTLALMLALVPIWSIDGAAFSFLLTQALLVPWFILTINRLLGVQTRTLLAQAYLPVLPAGFLAAVASFALRPYITGVPQLVGALLIAAAIYATVVVCFVLDSTERRACARFIARSFQTLQRALQTRHV